MNTFENVNSKIHKGEQVFVKDKKTDIGYGKIVPFFPAGRVFTVEFDRYPGPADRTVDELEIVTREEYYRNKEIRKKKCRGIVKEIKEFEGWLDSKEL